VSKELKMPGTGKIAAYAAMVVSLLATVIGGFGWLLPRIYGLDTDMMFVLLPTALVMTIVTIYFQITILVRMVRTDINRMENR